MAQHLFNGDSPSTGSDKAVLDGMFTELYALLAALPLSGIDVGLGKTPTTKFDVSLASEQVRMGSGSGNNTLQVYSGSNAIGLWSGGSNYMYSNTTITFIVGATVGASYPSGGINALIIDASGNLLNNQASTGYSTAESASVEGPNGRMTISHASGTASGALYHGFGYNGSAIGSITQSGTTGVAYNTSSDYRLKDNIQPMAGSGAFIDALKPCTWTWKSDGTTGAGFIAHELQAVSPASVTGAKDAVDAEGKPVYQAVEYGSAEVIAMLVAEVKALRARVHALDGN